MSQKYKRAKTLLEAGISCLAYSCWADIKQAVRAAEKWLIRHLKHLLALAVNAIAYYLRHKWWVATTILVLIIAVQQYTIIQTRMQVNNDSHQMLMLEQQLDSANMTFYKLKR